MGNDELVVAAFVQQRWPNGPICPRCKAGKPYLLGLGRWRCATCRRKFSATTGTVYEGSKLPLSVWLQVSELLRQGLNAHQIHVRLGLTYKTVRAMAKRVKPAEPAAPLPVPPRKKKRGRKPAWLKEAVPGPATIEEAAAIMQGG